MLSVGLWSVLDKGCFPDQTVSSSFGAGYGFVPLVPGLLWLRSARP